MTHCLRTLKGGRDLQVFSQIQSASRYGLLKGMADSENGILMGTSSFWEGIDLSGDMLEILIIAKLPFQVPSDPIVKAYGDRLSNNNMNPFMNFTVPECILKYRQGFKKGYNSKLRSNWNKSNLFGFISNKLLLINLRL